MLPEPSGAWVFPSVPSSFPGRDQPQLISAACLVTSADVFMTLSVG